MVQDQSILWTLPKRNVGLEVVHSIEDPLSQQFEIRQVTQPGNSSATGHEQVNLRIYGAGEAPNRAPTGRGAASTSMSSSGGQYSTAFAGHWLNRAQRTPLPDGYAHHMAGPGYSQLHVPHFVSLQPYNNTIGPGPISGYNVEQQLGPNATSPAGNPLIDATGLQTTPHSLGNFGTRFVHPPTTNETSRATGGNQENFGYGNSPAENTQHPPQLAVPPGTPDTDDGSINPNRTGPKAKIRWTVENDYTLLLFGLHREIAGHEFPKIAEYFKETPTPKAVQERLTKLRARTRQVLRESGIYDAETQPARTVAKSDLPGSPIRGAKASDKHTSKRQRMDNVKSADVEPAFMGSLSSAPGFQPINPGLHPINQGPQVVVPAYPEQHSISNQSVVAPMLNVPGPMGAGGMPSFHQHRRRGLPQNTSTTGFFPSTASMGTMTPYSQAHYSAPFTSPGHFPAPGSMAPPAPPFGVPGKIKITSKSESSIEPRTAASGLTPLGPHPFQRLRELGKSPSDPKSETRTDTSPAPATSAPSAQRFTPITGELPFASSLHDTEMGGGGGRGDWRGGMGKHLGSGGQTGGERIGEGAEDDDEVDAEGEDEVEGGIGGEEL